MNTSFLIFFMQMVINKIMIVLCLDCDTSDSDLFFFFFLTEISPKITSKIIPKLDGLGSI